jgi:hypothetical protein
LVVPVKAQDVGANAATLSMQDRDMLAKYLTLSVADRKTSAMWRWRWPWQRR